MVVNGVPPQHTTYDAHRCPHNGSFSCRRKCMTRAVVLLTSYFRPITERTSDAGKMTTSRTIHTMAPLNHIKVRVDLVQKTDSNMAASETLIRDGGISVRVMSDVTEVT